MASSYRSPIGRFDLPNSRNVADIVVGLSGGLDSSVLLHALAHSDIRHVHPIRAIHVHHGLHRHADRWAEHCADFCEALFIPLVVMRIVVDKNSEGMQAAARNARYAAFSNVLNKNDALALGHHRNDQAETFLLRALRASGTDGLGAMRAWRLHGNHWVWRPFLETDHAAIREYARAQSLRWEEDPSNTESAYDRNFLRLQVLPSLRKRWPHVDRVLTRSAALHGQAAHLLEAEDSYSLATARTIDANVLAVPALQALTTERRARVLRRWITEIGLTPMSAAGATQIEAIVTKENSDALPAFVWSDNIVQRWRGLLRAGFHRRPIEPFEIQWNGKAGLHLPDHGSLKLVVRNPDISSRLVGFDSPFLVRTRQGGERIQLPRRSHSHALKQVLQELGIPVWERTQLPLLVTQHGEVLAAGDLVYSHRFETWLRANNCRLQWTPNLARPMS